MPPTWRSVVPLVALLVLAGCAGLADTGDTGPSTDEFPDASDVDPSVFDTHADEMGNTSFTLTSEHIRKDRSPVDDRNFTYKNTTYEYFVESSDSQYHAQIESWFAGGNYSMYSDGSTTYETWLEGGERTVQQPPSIETFNESSDWYLWDGWFGHPSENVLTFAAINASYERVGTETYRGVPVMRYEASGVDALPADFWDGNASSAFDGFSATLLLDEDGVIRHYQYEFVYSENRILRENRTYSLSDVGSTDVERPDWVPNGSAG